MLEVAFPMAILDSLSNLLKVYMPAYKFHEFKILSMIFMQSLVIDKNQPRLRYA